ncbi:putative flavin-containing monooxygenase protein [Botrytis cinerea BcDW1]|uniref:Putative flavin-containing monooxygenase protein n=1 Tax=Botryotinia fuckeliana (strain BcDW1) TaxID=1290391 RepID=M7UIZ8_BOTF1|nr:putative flavin-containing monooxygenase protein [Botrytis cinerea BcDW1]
MPIETLQADEHRFAIILGAGAAGIIQGCTFIREKTLPLEEFQILERQSAFGGVWWKNTYPGAACDIPSHEYQISFALNPYWSRTFAPQPEIQKYFEDVALQYELHKSTTFNTEIVEAKWDDSRLLWLVETTDLTTGDTKLWSCHVLIGALGAFTVPKKAPVKNVDAFKGEEWHSVDWPKNANLRGKTVAVIGTGPSACQFIPNIYPEIKDDNLRRKLESKDVFGCKRPLMLSDYYPIFNNDNVELVTDSVTELTENGIKSRNTDTGEEMERETDVLIWGTGYNPVDFGLPVPTKGRSGQLLCDKYQPELFSLYGVAVDDFPNYFNFLGPNSSSFETSVMELFELQAHHNSIATEYLFQKNVGTFRYAIMPKEERVRSWTLSLRPGQAKLPPANPNCKSYYRSKIGHVYRYPYPYWQYKALIAKLDFKRDWVLLQQRIGQKEVKVLEF